MRHGKKFNHLGRKKGHRKALLTNLTIALIEHKRINTTLAKAKALRLFVEPLITKSKVNTTHSRRVVFSYLQNKEAAKELFGPVAATVGDRPGGYTRVIRTGFRESDGAEMALIELVDFNTIYDNSKTASKGRKRRTRRGSSGGVGKTAEVAATAPITAASSEEADKTAEVAGTAPVTAASSEEE